MICPSRTAKKLYPPAVGWSTTATARVSGLFASAACQLDPSKYIGVPVVKETLFPVTWMEVPEPLPPPVMKLESKVPLGPRTGIAPALDGPDDESTAETRVSLYGPLGHGRVRPGILNSSAITKGWHRLILGETRQGTRRGRGRSPCGTGACCPWLRQCRLQRLWLS